MAQVFSQPLHWTTTLVTSMKAMSVHAGSNTSLNPSRGHLLGFVVPATRVPHAGASYALRTKRNRTWPPFMGFLTARGRFLRAPSFTGVGVEAWRYAS